MAQVTSKGRELHQKSNLVMSGMHILCTGTSLFIAVVHPALLHDNWNWYDNCLNSLHLPFPVYFLRSTWMLKCNEVQATKAFIWLIICYKLERLVPRSNPAEFVWRINWPSNPKYSYSIIMSEFPVIFFSLFMWGRACRRLPHSLVLKQRQSEYNKMNQMMLQIPSGSMPNITTKLFEE